MKLRSYLSLLVCCMALCADIFGQNAGTVVTGAAAQPAATNKPAYDIVSVRPSKTENSMWQSKADGFLAETSLRGLIMSAYGLRMMDEISGLPGWGDSTLFHVETKMEEDQAAALGKLPGEERWKQQQLMLRAVLADRFQLKVHVLTKEEPIYALVVAKGGAKLKDSVAPSMFRIGNGEFTGQAMPISMLVASLSGVVGRLIVDKTGLTGKYDFSLHWSPDDLSGTPANDMGPTIFTAFEEQLGLKLEPQKAPLDYVVIDHVEKPSEN